MATNNPHLLKKHSLFALFCLSYLPLFILLIIKVCIANKKYLHYGGLTNQSFMTFFEQFGFVLILCLLICYAILGTSITMRQILTKKNNAFPVTIHSIKPKNEEALSYLGSYVIPLLMKGDTGLFEYATFVILFIVYYKLYSTSSLILINPILNFKYGLYEIEYTHGNDESKIKNGKIISCQQWLDEGEQIQILKLSHKLYFAY
ncbi:hypothetical protein BH11BAC3_BH11BAC3_46610 [soil metagenome]